MKKILIVDDEIQILKSLTRMFMDTDYRIYTAQNSNDALSIIESEGIDMIISDMRMHLVDGYRLLNIVKEKYPKIIRILLSGYTEEKPMYRALLHNLAKLYIFKPWNNNDFLMNVKKLFENDDQMNSRDLVDIIEDLDQIYDSPGNCNEIIARLKEENLDEVIKLIEIDPAISECLLEVSQTAIYGVMPNTIRQAAQYIGLPNLKSFIYWASLKGCLRSDKAEGNAFDTLQTHSYLTSRIFLFIYEAFLHKQPPEASMFAGLMHNVGLLIQLNSLRKNADIGLGADSSIDKLIRLDHEEYQHSQQMVGAHFIDIWDLPFSIYEATLYHHRPTDENIVHNELVSVVHIAQAYAWRVLSTSDRIRVEPDVFAGLSISVEDFEKRLARYMKQQKI